MCGICGIVDHRRRLSPIGAMNAFLRHRGPDDEGYVFANSNTGRRQEASGPDTDSNLSIAPLDQVCTESFDIALASRRLSILDLSIAGHMPMARADGKLWIVFNGEVYNYRELRGELTALGHRFASDTDTEVVLAAYEQWGYGCLPHFNGMFSFAIWDAPRRRVFIARDRFGVKPLYYYHRDGAFLFASEIKSLLAHPLVPRSPNESVIYDYLVLGQSDHSEHTFFEGVQMLPPAHFLVLELPGGQASLRKWWRLDVNSALEGELDDRSVCADFRAQLEDAVRLRMRTDVPLGSCLSGGLDSSSIVCLANKLLLTEGAVPNHLLGTRQKTFTARNSQPEIDETEFSRLIVNRTGAEENLVLPSGERLWEELRTFVWHMDEPVDSTSQYPQWNVMRLARQRGVTVLLDGQGGDEILGGYTSYWPYYLSQVRQEKSAGAFLRATWDAVRIGGTRVSDVLYQHWAQKLPWRVQQVVRALRPYRIGLGTGGGGLQEWQIARPLMKHFWHRRWRPRPAVDGQGLAGLLYQDVVSANLPKLLRYEDRSSMAFSLETRLPFLDFRLVESVFSLPLNYRIRDGWSKWILRQSLSGLLPVEIARRKSKLGFPVPERAWLQAGGKFIRAKLRSPMSREIEQYVDAAALARMRRLDDSALAATPGLWRIVNLIVWFEVFMNGSLRSVDAVRPGSRSMVNHQ